jgi:Zn-dependent protease
MHWWASSYLEAGQYWILYLYVMWVIVSICLHELAHGWAALQQGDSTPRDLNRMTWNPLVHMGGLALIAFALIGITWGSMPVNPSRFKWGRWGDMWVAAAGPLMNLALAIVLFTTLGILCGRAGIAPIDVITADQKFLQVFLIGGLLNMALFAFNLLPVPPLDGAAIVAGVSKTTHRFYHSEGMQRFGILGLLIIFATGIGGYLIGVASIVGLVYCSLIAAFFGQ